MRRDVEHPWAFDVVVSGGDESGWSSRRDPSSRWPWSEAIECDDATPYLAPHTQLLLKSKAVRPKDELDAQIVIPALSRLQRIWPAGHLPPEHPWQRTARPAAFR